MALPMAFVVLTAAGRAVARFATKQAAQKAAKQIGGKVAQRSMSKTTQKLPTGSSSQGRAAVEKNVLRAKKDTGVAPRSSKGPQLKGEKRAAPKKKPSMASRAATALSGGATASAVLAGIDEAIKAKTDKKLKPRGMDPSGIAKKKTNNRAQSQGGRSRAEVVTQRQESLAAKSKAQGGGPVLSERAKAKESREPAYRDAPEPRTIAEAKRMGKDYFINKQGQKRAAVTKEELEKSGLSLRDYLNKKAGKGKYAAKKNKGSTDYRQGGMLLGVNDRRKKK